MYYDVIIIIANCVHCLMLCYVAAVTLCCELPDKMSIYLRNRWLWQGGVSRGSASVRLLGLGLESYRGHGCLSLVNVVCCQVEVSASDHSSGGSYQVCCVCYLEAS